MTQETKYTPAPWIKEAKRTTIINGKAHTIIEVIAPNAENKNEYDALGICVALLPDGEYSSKEKDEAEANTRLIAAAPKLLEALEIVLAQIPKDILYDYMPFPETILNAINEAKGRS